MVEGVKNHSTARPTACILHISDLHLGLSFQDCGGPARGGVKDLLKNKALRMQAHDPQILIMLPLELQRLERLVQARFRTAWRDETSSQSVFDRIIVSGDISTDVYDERRFQFAFNYLTAKVEALKDALYSEQSKVGLELNNDLLLCVPGNHDKMGESDLSKYYSSFAQSPDRCNYVRYIRKHGQLIVFFCLDSNDYAEGNIALGEIDNARLAWLSTTLRTLEQEGFASNDEAVSPEEFGTAVRCLVLHHHVLDLSLSRRFSILNPLRSFTILKGAKNLLDLVAGRIQVIFHGHEHYPVTFCDKGTGIIVISAGTVSQWSKKRGHNSFFLITFFEDNSLEVQEYVWSGSGFRSRQESGATNVQQRYQLLAITP